MKRLQVGLAALALVVAPTLGEDVSAPVGVTVGVPEGFRYRADLKPKPTTVLAFQAKSGEAAILINSIKTSGIGSLDELAKSAQEELGREVTFVTVPAGRLFRFDLEFKDGDPPQSFRERIYMTLHDGRVFQFVLHDEATAFEGHLDSFDAMVAGVRLGQVAQQPPSDPVEPPPADDPPSDPVAPPPADPAPTGPQTNLLRKAKLVSFSSEYASDYWAAKNLIDGSTERTQSWASRPGSKPPHRFVFHLARAAALTRAEFEGTGGESGIEGASAKGFRLEVSAVGPGEGFETVLEGNLKAEGGTQGFLLPEATRGEWVRLTLTSNHGNPTLTELAELRLFGPSAPASKAPVVAGAKLRVERLRVSQSENGPAHEGAFAAGSRVWVCFKPRGLSAGPDGKYSIEVDLILEDGEGNTLLTRERVLAHTARLPAPPLSPFVAVFLDLPAKGFPAGTYGVRLAVRDTLSGSSAGSATPFEVE